MLVRNRLKYLLGVSGSCTTVAKAQIKNWCAKKSTFHILLIIITTFFIYVYKFPPFILYYVEKCKSKWILFQYIAFEVLVP